MNPTRTISRSVALLGLGALGLAACGGGSSNGNAAAATTTAAKAPAITAKTISGQSVLAYRGHTLYSPAQEKSGKITCTAGCVKVWGPVKASAKKGSKVTKLGSVTRPDGKKQLTYKSLPLYTFIPEGKGKLSGDGLKDSFGGHKFTWHVVKTKKSSSNPPAPQQQPSNGYGY
jgi:predicted lipoprotein with Yx(FWY)xxD motif